jgi:hypothetical protein
MAILQRGGPGREPPACGLVQRHADPEIDEDERHDVHG